CRRAPRRAGRVDLATTGRAPTRHDDAGSTMTDAPTTATAGTPAPATQTTGPGAGRRGPLALDAGDAARVATFAALIAALGMPGSLALFGNAVPLTLQTLGVMLAGTILGAWRGALAVATFLALAAAGLPVLAGGRG